MCCCCFRFCLSRFFHSWFWFRVSVVACLFLVNTYFLFFVSFFCNFYTNYDMCVCASRVEPSRECAFHFCNLFFDDLFHSLGSVHALYLFIRVPLLASPTRLRSLRTLNHTSTIYSICMAIHETRNTHAIIIIHVLVCPMSWPVPCVRVQWSLMLCACCSFSQSSRLKCNARDTCSNETQVPHVKCVH